MNRLAFLQPTDVAALSRHEREDRVRLLVQQSHNIVTRAAERHANVDGRSLVATVVLFSGGNDSTVLAHMMRARATHAAHANTTIGIEATRDFVRKTCASWDLRLLEFTPPRLSDHYENLVVDQGFPGPGHHFKMYQRLKERSLEAVRRQLVTNPYRERVMFLAGRRRTESARRASIPAVERRGSTVWVSPLVNWTTFDLTTYRLIHGDVPVNEVTNMIHMSGECLCGSFAKPGEREELAFWFPSFEAQIQRLEERVACVPGIPDHRRRWGWGASVREADRRRGPSGPLCSSCDARASAVEG
jgi:3'-phosphoadenosine 5'-phosphosulfate sulfotransferase (PAPS reductase)/FAD synthetase